MRYVLGAIPLILAACSTTGYMRDAQPTPPPGDHEAKVIIYRTASFGGAYNFAVYELVPEDGKLLGFTETDRYFEIRCTPGHHIFAALGEGEAFVEAELEGGKTYFIRAYSKFGVVTPRPGFAPVGRDSEHWPEVEEVLPQLQCRELDPSQTVQIERRQEGRVRESMARFQERKAAPRTLDTDDGRPEKTLQAK